MYILWQSIITRLALLAVCMTNTVAVLLSNTCYWLLHITDSRYTWQSNTATRHDCRGYLAHRMLHCIFNVSHFVIGSEGETRRAGVLQMDRHVGLEVDRWVTLTQQTGQASPTLGNLSSIPNLVHSIYMYMYTMYMYIHALYMIDSVSLKPTAKRIKNVISKIINKCWSTCTHAAAFIMQLVLRIHYQLWIQVSENFTLLVM